MISKRLNFFGPEKEMGNVKKLQNKAAEVPLSAVGCGNGWLLYEQASSEVIDGAQSVKTKSEEKK